jgi:hypothetical protein
MQEVRRLPEPIKVYLIQDSAPDLYDPWVVEQIAVAETDRRYHFSGFNGSDDKSACFLTKAEAYKRLISHVEAKAKRTQDLISKLKYTLSCIKDEGQ